MGNTNVIAQLCKQDKGRRENNTYTKKTLETLTKLTEYRDTDSENHRILCWIHFWSISSWTHKNKSCCSFSFSPCLLHCPKPPQHSNVKGHSKKFKLCNTELCPSHSGWADIDKCWWPPHDTHFHTIHQSNPPSFALFQPSFNTPWHEAIAR